MKKMLIICFMRVFLVACSQTTPELTPTATPILSPTTTPLPTPTVESEEVRAARLIAEARGYLPEEGFETIFGTAEIDSFDEVQIDPETKTIYADSDYWRIKYIEGFKKWVIEARAETMDERLIERVKKDYLEKHPEFKDWDEVRKKVLSLRGIKWRPQTPEMSYWTAEPYGVNFMNVSGLEIGSVPMKVKGLDKNAYGLVDILYRPSQENPDDVAVNYAWGVVAYTENGEVLPNSLPTETANFESSPNYSMRGFIVGEDNTILLKNNFKNFVLNRSAESRLVFSYLTIPLSGSVAMNRSAIGQGIAVNWLSHLDRSKSIDLLFASYFMDFTPQGSVTINGKEKLVKNLTWEELAIVLQERQEVSVVTMVSASY